MTAIPRYAAEQRFPPYTYIPGRSPHPISDPAGHSHGRHAAGDLDQAAVARTFRFAVDLFNHGYYWEAHETWEAVWKSLGAQGPAADGVKGLIKLAAAGVKTLQDQPSGAVSHARRSAELLTSAARNVSVFRSFHGDGLNWSSTAEAAARFADLLANRLATGPIPACDVSPTAPQAVLPMGLSLTAPGGEDPA